MQDPGLPLVIVPTPALDGIAAATAQWLRRALGGIGTVSALIQLPVIGLVTFTAPVAVTKC